MLLIVFLAIISMSLKDVVGTLMVICESRGKAVYAGVLDALGDIASLATFGVGIETVLNHGVSMESAFVLGALLTTSFIMTTITTHFGAKYIKDTSNIL